MPILGIMASQITGNLVTSSFESIQTVSVAAGNSTSTITFSSIPQTYTHLQIRAIYRSTGSNVYNAWFTGTINGDTAANYSNHILAGNGTSAGAGGGANVTTLDGFSRPGSDSAAGNYGAMVMDILDYANTNKYKTLRHFAGANINVSTPRLDVGLISNNWRSNAAITSISFYGNQGPFAEYSSFALYGIKG